MILGERARKPPYRFNRILLTPSPRVGERTIIACILWSSGIYTSRSSSWQLWAYSNSLVICRGCTSDHEQRLFKIRYNCVTIINYQRLIIARDLLGSGKIVNNKVCSSSNNAKIIIFMDWDCFEHKLIWWAILSQWLVISDNMNIVN